MYVFDAVESVFWLRHGVFSRAEEIWPAIRDFKPDLLILSSGFDAHEADPLALIYLTDEDYAWVTEGSLRLADELCAGRVVRHVFGFYSCRLCRGALEAEEI